MGRIRFSTAATARRNSVSARSGRQHPPRSRMLLQAPRSDGLTTNPSRLRCRAKRLRRQHEERLILKNPPRGSRDAAPADPGTESNRAARHKENQSQRRRSSVPGPSNEDDEDIMRSVEFTAAVHLGHGPARNPSTKADLAEKSKGRDPAGGAKESPLSGIQGAPMADQKACRDQSSQMPGWSPTRTCPLPGSISVPPSPPSPPR